MALSEHPQLISRGSAQHWFTSEEQQSPHQPAHPHSLLPPPQPHQPQQTWVSPVGLQTSSHGRDGAAGGPPPHHISVHFCSSLQKEAGKPQGHCWAGSSILASAGIHQCRASPGAVPRTSLPPWKRNPAEKPPFPEVVQPSGRSPGVEGLQDLPVPSPGWVLVTQQCRGPVY